MGETTQKERMMSISTPLGKDVLLIDRLTVTEEISSLFSYEIELLYDHEGENDFKPHQIDPKKLLGQAVSIDLKQRDGTTRTFSGIVNNFSQGHRDPQYSYYFITVVPNLWLLTQISQSRIFQHISVPEILKKVLEGFSVSYELQGTYKPRNYCSQYRETDFDFVSRLMEEEGIFYFFEHKGGKNKLIIADTPQSHLDCPSKSEIPYALEIKEKGDFTGRIIKWQDAYRLQTGTITFWDHHLQTKANKLDATQPTLYKVADNEQLEFYDYPGRYAKNFDDIDRGGGKRADVQNVFEDKTKKAEIAMQALDSKYRVISGRGDCSSMTVGHRFKLIDHPNDSQNGQYVITSITHEIEQSPGYRTNDEIDEPYTNNFSCIAYGAGAPPFRPARRTPKPIVQGSQTAFVVGPAGEEIFTDELGRVKVQFHWDRDGKNDSDSSCWVSVAQSWASNRWGMMFIPRIGMEVIVHFLEGDPDQPIITGCVYNPGAMPPYTLPDEKTKMTIKSDSSPGGGGFNELRFEDKKGAEQIFIHGERNLDVRIKNDRRDWTGNEQHLMVIKNRYEKIGDDTHLTVGGHQNESVGKDHNLKITGKEAIETGGGRFVKVGGSAGEKVSGNKSITATNIYLKASAAIIIEAPQVSLKGAGGFVDVGPSGVSIKGTMVLINSGGAAGSGSEVGIVAPAAPKPPDKADDAKPGTIIALEKRSMARKRKTLKGGGGADDGSGSGSSGENDETKKSWIEIKLVDEAGNPVPGEAYEVKTSDGVYASGTLDEKGYAKVAGIEPGDCEVTFTNLDKGAWEDA